MDEHSRFTDQLDSVATFGSVTSLEWHNGEIYAALMARTVANNIAKTCKHEEMLAGV